LAVVPDPRVERLLAAMRAVRDGDPDARAAVAGDDELAELGALFDQLAGRNQALAGQLGLRERAQQLALASRARAEFMATISHELRTPLSSLLILAQLLADNTEGNLTPRQVDFARTIHGAAQDLLQLINDLLDLSKVESGRMELRTEKVPVAPLLARLEAAFRDEAAQKGLELRVRTAPDVPETVDTDEQRLEQVLRNLLSNALRFTDHGAVALEATRDPAVPELLRLAVHDTGVGISPDKLEVIFEAFQQAGPTAGQQPGGTGLGLSIGRELARLLGGDLLVSSVVGQGSTFTVSLPAGTPEAQRAAAAAGPGSGRAVVLVVEPRGSRAMGQAAHTALDGLSGIRDRVEIVAVRGAGGGPDSAEQVLAARDVVAVLVNLGITREQLHLLLAAVADYAPMAPVLAYEAGAGSAAAIRLETAPGGDPRIEIVGSRAQAVERLTLHLLTGLPGASAAPATLAADAPQGAVRFHGETVLVVDDDVRNVFAMTSVLELHGLTVVHADNGRQGIETLLQNPDIRLVLMDLMMPGMDGYAATRHIRSLERFAGLPIIAVTAKTARGDREKSLAAGADEHVVKPVDVDRLLAVISKLMNR
jgi:signal transduction histidine kinase/CheY-like chemotaxis protein